MKRDFKKVVSSIRCGLRASCCGECPGVYVPPVVESGQVQNAQVYIMYLDTVGAGCGLNHKYQSLGITLAFHAMLGFVKEINF